SAPAKPTGVALQTPVNDAARPEFMVSGLISGNTVTLYSDSTCETAIGSATATGGSQLVATEELTVDGTYTVYATSTDPAGNESACSTATDSYLLDLLPPELTSVCISSGGGKSKAGVGGQAILLFVASEPLASTTVTIHGQAATVTNPFGRTY